MKRIIILFSIVTILGVSNLYNSYGQDNNPTPNILWITLEDISPQFVGCYGNKDVITPNIDKIAREGVMFTRAYSNGTVCAPSRSTIITGCRTEVIGTGNHRSNVPIPDTICGFPTYIRAKGYYTANIGKTDYNTANAKKIIKSSWDINSGKKGGWNGRSGDQPFFAVFNVFACHQSRTMTMPFNWYEENILAHLPDSLTTQMGQLEMPPIYRNTPEMQKYLARVYNSINAADVRVGQILDQLQHDGLLDETIIFIFGDHGEAVPRGKGSAIALGHRVPFIAWFPDKYRHLSPWKYSDPTDELVSFEDLAPSMLSLVGAEIPDYMNGRPFLGSKRVEGERCLYGSRNRLDAAPGTLRSVMMGDYVYTRSFHPYLPMLKYKHYHDVADITKAIRRDYENGKLNDIQSLMLLRNEVESLYDIENDEWETINLVDNPAYESKLKTIRDSLWADMARNKDVHLIPEYEIDQIVQSGQRPFDVRNDQDFFPVSEIIETIKLIGKNKNIEEQIDRLKSTNRFVRYWAAVGLNSQVSGMENYEKDIEPYLTDNYPPVQIEIASVLAKFYHSTAAYNILKSYIGFKDVNLSNQAVQMVQHLEEKQQRIFMDELKDLSKSSDKRRAYPAQVVLFYLNGQPDLIAGTKDSYFRPYYSYYFENSLFDSAYHGKLIGDVNYRTVKGNGRTYAFLQGSPGLKTDEDFFLTGEFLVNMDFYMSDHKDATLILLSDSVSGNKLSIHNKGKDLQVIRNCTKRDLHISLQKEQWYNLKFGYQHNQFFVYIDNQQQLIWDIDLSPELIRNGSIAEGFYGGIDNFEVYHFSTKNFQMLSSR